MRKETGKDNSTDIKRDELVDIADVKINTDLPVEERIKDYISSRSKTRTAISATAQSSGSASQARVNSPTA